MAKKKGKQKEPHTPALSKKPKKPTKMKHITRKQANALVIESEIAIQQTLEQLQEVRSLAAKAGLSIDCKRLPKTAFTAPVPD
eukprot:CAMPEP_0176128152 /NCGR_PEP_ID=MMETSP0120_2-20121206/64749_1 /TAXON_ID=160619 /ORGANISM="Kryptoperidinium foliaceum, Strain CCMP 1326" /LENGTH=82 /DNA_ID=CAMNT_0017463231 /DNA_START=66 /DNA_END=311 /DNA_ORIENTATION=-